MMNGYGWAMDPGGWLWMILTLAIIVAVVWLVTAALPGRQRHTAEDAIQILKVRFARGEISEVAYEQARRVLEISRTTQAAPERNER